MAQQTIQGCSGYGQGWSRPDTNAAEIDDAAKSRDLLEDLSSPAFLGVQHRRFRRAVAYDPSTRYQTARNREPAGAGKLRVRITLSTTLSDDWQRRCC